MDQDKIKNLDLADELSEEQRKKIIDFVNILIHVIKDDENFLVNNTIFESDLKRLKEDLKEFLDNNDNDVKTLINKNDEITKYNFTGNVKLVNHRRSTLYSVRNILRFYKIIYLFNGIVTENYGVEPKDDDNLKKLNDSYNKYKNNKNAYDYDISKIFTFIHDSAIKIKNDIYNFYDMFEKEKVEEKDKVEEKEKVEENKPLQITITQPDVIGNDENIKLENFIKNKIGDLNKFNVYFYNLLDNFKQNIENLINKLFKNIENNQESNENYDLINNEFNNYVDNYIQNYNNRIGELINIYNEFNEYISSVSSEIEIPVDLIKKFTLNFDYFSDMCENLLFSNIDDLANKLLNGEMDKDKFDKLYLDKTFKLTVEILRNYKNFTKDIIMENYYNDRIETLNKKSIDLLNEILKLQNKTVQIVSSNIINNKINEIEKKDVEDRNELSNFIIESSHYEIKKEKENEELKKEILDEELKEEKNEYDKNEEERLKNSELVETVPIKSGILETEEEFREEHPEIEEEHPEIEEEMYTYEEPDEEEIIDILPDDKSDSSSDSSSDYIEMIDRYKELYSEKKMKEGIKKILKNLFEDEGLPIIKKKEEPEPEPAVIVEEFKTKSSSSLSETEKKKLKSAIEEIINLSKNNKNLFNINNSDNIIDSITKDVLDNKKKINDVKNDIIDNLLESKIKKVYPNTIKKTIKLMSISKTSDSNVKIVGSYGRMGDRYPGDIDIVETFNGTPEKSSMNDVINFFIKSLNNILNKIDKNDKAFFIELKAGTDERYDFNFGEMIDGNFIKPTENIIKKLNNDKLFNKDEIKLFNKLLNLSKSEINGKKIELLADECSEIIRRKKNIKWNQKNIRNGFKIIKGKRFSLKKALLQKDCIIKYDSIFFIDKRFIEVSNYLFLGYEKNDTVYHINLDKEKTLKELPLKFKIDIEKYYCSDFFYDSYKSLKRLRSLLDSMYFYDKTKFNDKKTVELLSSLTNLFNSDAGVYNIIKSQMDAMINVLYYYNKTKLIDDYIKKQYDTFYTYIGYLTSIPKNLLNKFKNNYDKIKKLKNSDSIIKIINEIRPNIVKLINEKSILFMENENINPPSMYYSKIKRYSNITRTINYPKDSVGLYYYGNVSMKRLNKF